MQTDIGFGIVDIIQVIIAVTTTIFRPLQFDGHGQAGEGLHRHGTAGHIGCDGVGDAVALCIFRRLEVDGINFLRLIGPSGIFVKRLGRLDGKLFHGQVVGGAGDGYIIRSTCSPGCSCLQKAIPGVRRQGDQGHLDIAVGIDGVPGNIRSFFRPVVLNRDTACGAVLGNFIAGGRNIIFVAAGENLKGRSGTVDGVDQGC